MTTTTHAVVPGPTCPGPGTRADRLQALRARMLADGWRVVTESPSDQERADMECWYREEKAL
jgi:hypothetical protein